MQKNLTMLRVARVFTYAMFLLISVNSQYADFYRDFATLFNQQNDPSPPINQANSNQIDTSGLTINNVSGVLDFYRNFAAFFKQQNQSFAGQKDTAGTTNNSLGQQQFLTLADQSSVSSLADKFFSIGGWGASKMGGDINVNKDNTVIEPYSHTLTDGKTMAYAILKRRETLWKWRLVLDNRFKSLNGFRRHFYEMTCCQHLPYICAVDGLCVIESENCEKFCECASNPHAGHCVRTIPRLKKTMRKLQKDLVYQVAREQNMKVPADIERMLNNQGGPESLVDRKSKALAILEGKEKSWSWNDVLENPFYLSIEYNGDSFFKIDCCLRLPYICGIDGLCILDSIDCESFCECASKPCTKRCTPTIQRLKRTMRNLEREAILLVAKEQRIVVSSNVRDIFSIKDSVITTIQSITTNHSSSTTARSIIKSNIFQLMATLNFTSTPAGPTSTFFIQSHSKSAPSISSVTVKPSSTSSIPTHLHTTLAFNSTSTVSQSMSKSLTNRLSMSKLKSTKSVILKSLIMASATKYPPTSVAISHRLVSTERPYIITPTTRTPFTKINEFTSNSLITVQSNILLSSTEPKSSSLPVPRWSSSTVVTQGELSTNIYATSTRTEKHAEPATNETSRSCHGCEDNGGVCVIDHDFYPHCVKLLSVDACEQFRCVHGSCISTDGVYSCECFDGWTGTFCDKKCPLHCGEKGFCAQIDDGERVTCVCHWNYTGEQCGQARETIPKIKELPIQEDDFQLWEVTVVAIVSAIIMASSCILLPYCLWRRQWLPIRKLVFFLKDYEEDDGKEYDAFISYKSCPRDQRFVLNHLYPKLEKELDFRLCLHFRDFPPGAPIANNIIYAIENSRRTILILSPNYVKSEWCRMEYQKAQHEMLRLKHKIIPIILEDIDGILEMDENLRTIIDTVTYIKWPGEIEVSFSKRIMNFWKLLELSMPKKRSEISQSYSSSSNMPMTNTPKTCFSSIIDSLSNFDDISSSTNSTYSPSDGSSCNDLELQSEQKEIIPRPYYITLPLPPFQYDETYRYKRDFSHLSVLPSNNCNLSLSGENSNSMVPMDINRYSNLWNCQKNLNALISEPRDDAKSSPLDIPDPSSTEKQNNIHQLSEKS